MSARSTTLPLALAAGGWMVSGYLMLRLRALGDDTAAAPDLCSAAFAASCDDALRSPFSSTLGISLTGWGMLYYAVLFLLLL